MSLNCCSHLPIARAAQFVFVAVGGVVGEIGDAWGWLGGGGSPKDCGCPRGSWAVGRKALGTMTGVLNTSQRH